MRVHRADTDTTTGNGARSFTGLVNRLVTDVLRLIDQKIELLKVEMKEELGAFVRRTALLAVGGVVAALGSLLLLLAVTFWVGELVGSIPGGFAIVGGVFVLGGLIVLLTMKARLQRQRLVPELTVRELRRDVQWIKHEL
jgi:uncharacterized membrane protein YqjE